MRIGVQLHPQHAHDADIRRAVIRAEELGVDIVYNWDRFYPLHGEPDGKHFEAWTMLASGVLDDWGAKVGRNPAAIEKSVGVDPTRIDANELIKGRAQQVTLGFKGPDFDMSVIATCLTWRDQPTAA